LTDATQQRGVVLSGTGGVWQVLDASGVRRDARLRGRLKQESVSTKLAVGDAVVLEGGAADEWVITEILPRRSQLARREPGGGPGQRVVVANVDQVIVVFAAAKPEPHPRMLDRFLVIAAANELHARIVVNKVDLVGQGSAQERFAEYERIGYPVHFTSTKQGVGLEALHDALADRISALSGPSGVGKSSLLNAIFPGLGLRVGEISESVNKGRHTTVGALLHPLPGGGFVADTPGLREVGVWGLDPSRLDRCFPELASLVDECRFGDCTHSVEPGCAVREALQQGDVSPARFDSYQKLRAELQESDRSY
jgi:ribosome biogenesis GTPase / thiamine phosphate phosphatase